MMRLGRGLGVYLVLTAAIVSLARAQQPPARASESLKRILNDWNNPMRFAADVRRMKDADLTDSDVIKILGAERFKQVVFAAQSGRQAKQVMPIWNASNLSPTLKAECLKPDSPFSEAVRVRLCCKNINRRNARIVLRTHAGLLRPIVDNAYAVTEGINPLHFFAAKAIVVATGREPVTGELSSRPQALADMVWYAVMLIGQAKAMKTLNEARVTVRAINRATVLNPEEPLGPNDAIVDYELTKTIRREKLIDPHYEGLHRYA